MRFKEYSILKENPDDLYSSDSECSSFAFCKDFVMFIKNNKNLTHRDILYIAKKQLLKIQFKDFINHTITIERLMRDSNNYYYHTGEPPAELINYLRNSASYIGRTTYIRDVDGGFLGRIATDKNIISFWHSADSFSPADKRTVTKIIKLYNKNPKDMMYNFVNHDEPETNMTYEQFYNITQSVTPVKQADTSKFIHGLSGDKKKAALLQMGARPRAAKGVEDRYLQGESFKDFFQTLIESPDMTVKRFPDQETGSPIGWPESDARSFIIADDFICITKRNTTWHNHMYPLIEDAFNHNDKKARTNFIMHGTPSVAFLSQMWDGAERRKLVAKYPNWIQGRIWLEHKYISFWNHGINVRNNLPNISLMIQMLGDDPENFSWELDNEDVLTFDQVKSTPNIDGELPKTKKDSSWQKQLHLLSPEEKNKALKAMGIKPKDPLGAEIRYAMGESFKSFFLQMFTENPDRIRDRDDPSKWIVYNKNDESYTILLFTDNTPGTFAIRKDSPKDEGAGHAYIRQILRELSDNINEIKSDVPLDEIADKANGRSAYEVRIWTHNKIISFWQDWEPNIIQPTLKLFKFLGQNPEEYIFEFDRSYYNSNADDSPGCFTYEEFSTGKKDHSPEALRLKQQRIEDRKILAQSKLGMLNKDQALRDTDVKIKNLGKAPSFYKRSGD